MAQMPALRTISNGTPADAADPEYNFAVIESHLATEVINRDGSVAMQGPLVLSGPPITDSQAATKGYVDSLRFPGEMVEYGGDTAPAGWALCNGQTQSSTDPNYAALFAVIGYRFGDAGGGNFKLPDFRERVSVGRNPAVLEFDTVGETGGNASDGPAHVHNFNATHSHTTPVHSHTINSHSHSMTHTHSINPPSATTAGAGSHSHGITDGAAIMKAFGPVDLDRHDGGSAYDINIDTFSAEGGHTHEVNVGSFASGGSSSGNTGSTGLTTNQGGDPTLTGTNSTTIDKDTASSGAATNGNYPPFVVVTKIVKL